jgi:hypothetical protein
MTALESASRLCTELDSRRVAYALQIVRDALMVTVAVPGEWWEIEFFDDGHIEHERFVSRGVVAEPTAVDDLLRYFDE